MGLSGGEWKGNIKLWVLYWCWWVLRSWGMVFQTIPDVRSTGSFAPMESVRAFKEENRSTCPVGFI